MSVCPSVMYSVKTCKHIFNFCRAMRCISAAYVGMQCLSLSVCVCPSVRHVRELSLVPKRIKISSKFFSPSGSQAILVFPRQTGWRYSDGNPPNGSVECRRGRQKNAILNEYLASLHTGLQCCQPYESRSVKIKPRRTAASVEHTAASVVRCSHKTRTKCL